MEQCKQKLRVLLNQIDRIDFPLLTNCLAVRRSSWFFVLTWNHKLYLQKSPNRSNLVIVGDAVPLGALSPTGTHYPRMKPSASV